MSHFKCWFKWPFLTGCYFSTVCEKTERHRTSEFNEQQTQEHGVSAKPQQTRFQVCHCDILKVDLLFKIYNLKKEINEGELIELSVCGPLETQV